MACGGIFIYLKRSIFVNNLHRHQHFSKQNNTIYPIFIYIMRRRICIISILLVLLPQSVCSLVYPSAHRHSIQKVSHSKYFSPRHRQYTTISNHNKNIYRQHYRSVSCLTTKEDSSDDSIVSSCRLLQKVFLSVHISMLLFLNLPGCTYHIL